MTTYRCPTHDENGAPLTELVGCGVAFTIDNAEPWVDGNDDCVDCPNCGLFWPFRMYQVMP